jgi:hypothetical protein
MSTLLTQIGDAMRTALDTGRPAGVPSVGFWTGLPVDTGALPHRTLGWLNESVQPVGPNESALVRRSVRFAVEDLVAASSTISAQAAAEPLRAWSVRALAGNRYLDAGGVPLAIHTAEIGTQWELEQAEVPFCRVIHEFEVTFTTRANDAELRV